MATESGDTSSLRARIRAWWAASTFLGDVALLFTVVTVGNSVMMLTGLDEPKDGTFAYVHLLGRFGIITVLVGLFSLDEARGWFARWRRQRRQPSRGDLRRHSTRSAFEAIRRSLLRRGFDGAARVFAAVVVASCALTVALAEIRTPAGGPGLYRNLVLFALILLPAMSLAARRERRTTRPIHLDHAEAPR